MALTGRQKRHLLKFMYVVVIGVLFAGAGFLMLHAHNSADGKNGGNSGSSFKTVEIGEKQQEQAEALVTEFLQKSAKWGEGYTAWDFDSLRDKDLNSKGADFTTQSATYDKDVKPLLSTDTDLFVDPSFYENWDKSGSGNMETGVSQGVESVVVDRVAEQGKEKAFQNKKIVNFEVYGTISLKQEYSAYLMRGEGGENAYNKYTMISNPEPFKATVSVEGGKILVKNVESKAVSLLALPKDIDYRVVPTFENAETEKIVPGA